MAHTQENKPSRPVSLFTWVPCRARCQKSPFESPTPRHIIIKLPKVKDKERILKAGREKQLVTYKGVPIRLSADFSKGTLQARRDWQEVFQAMKSRDLQPRLFYPAKLSFGIKG